MSESISNEFNVTVIKTFFVNETVFVKCFDIKVISLHYLVPGRINKNKTASPPRKDTICPMFGIKTARRTVTKKSVVEKTYLLLLSPSLTSSSPSLQARTHKLSTAVLGIKGSR